MRRNIFRLMTTNRTICQGIKVRKKIVQRVGIGAITPSVTAGDMVRVWSLMITPESGSSLA
jgi:hypothetical protein